MFCAARNYLSYLLASALLIVTVAPASQAWSFAPHRDKYDWNRQRWLNPFWDREASTGLTECIMVFDRHESVYSLSVLQNSDSLPSCNCPDVQKYAASEFNDYYFIERLNIEPVRVKYSNFPSLITLELPVETRSVTYRQADHAICDPWFRPCGPANYHCRFRPDCPVVSDCGYGLITVGVDDSFIEMPVRFLEELHIPQDPKSQINLYRPLRNSEQL